MPERPSRQTEGNRCRVTRVRVHCTRLCKWVHTRALAVRVPSRHKKERSIEGRASRRPGYRPIWTASAGSARRRTIPDPGAESTCHLRFSSFAGNIWLTDGLAPRREAFGHGQIHGLTGIPPWLGCAPQGKPGTLAREGITGPSPLSTLLEFG